MASHLNTPQSVLDAPVPQAVSIYYAEPYRRSEPKRSSKKRRRHDARDARKS